MVVWWCSDVGGVSFGYFGVVLVTGCCGDRSDKCKQSEKVGYGEIRSGLNINQGIGGWWVVWVVGDVVLGDVVSVNCYV